MEWQWEAWDPSLAWVLWAEWEAWEAWEAWEVWEVWEEVVVVEEEEDWAGWLLQARRCPTAEGSGLLGK